MKKAVKALLIDQENKILTMYRSATHPKWAHQIDFPGGVVEKGEDDIDALIREIKEECGFTIDRSMVKKLSTYKTPIITRDIFAVYLKNSPNVKISWEHESYRWVAIDTLLNMKIPNNTDRYVTEIIKCIKLLD